MSQSYCLVGLASNRFIQSGLIFISTRHTFHVSNNRLLPLMSAFDIQYLHVMLCLVSMSLMVLSIEYSLFNKTWSIVSVEIQASKLFVLINLLKFFYNKKITYHRQLKYYIFNNINEDLSKDIQLD